MNSGFLNEKLTPILMIILGVASHYASRIRGDGDVEYAKKKAKKVLGCPQEE